MLKAGWNFCDITELFHDALRGGAGASSEPGTYRNITGNPALAMGLIAASRRSGLPLFLGAYPITPASDVLHELATLQELRRHHVPGRGRDRRGLRGDRRLASAARSASPSPRGPGIALKAEAMGLAVMTELPLVVFDIQRGGPSTGLPTKTEQADLLQVMFGRNGESPLPVIAAASPAGLLRRRARGGAASRSST